MAANLLHSLAENNSDLQKQIGCMTGIFQLFDRQYILNGRRTAHKRLLLGNSHTDSGNLRRESSITHQQGTVMALTRNESVDERQRVVTESSGVSVSSSSSSSFSSMEFNKESQPETSLHPERQHLNLRDVVKDSMYREARRLPEKTVSNSVKHRESQSRDGSSKVVIHAKPNSTIDLYESVKVLAKLRDAPRYYNETWHSGSRDVPHDQKERNRLSFEAVKSSPKQNELPRLSLDGREASIKSTPSHLSRNFQSNGYSNETGPQKSAPSVVAKLMGLEALPHSFLASRASLVRTIKTVDSPINPVNESTSRHRKNADRLIKPIHSSKPPLEIAPWHLLDGNRGIQKLSYQANSSPSVYGEIEKRVKNVEFKQSEKDLRALKQILEAIQSKGLLGSESEDRSSNMIFQKDYELKSVSPRQNTRLVFHQNKHRKPVIGLTSREPDSSWVLESPIVVMKPAKLREKVISVSQVIPKVGHPQLQDSRKSGSSRAIKEQSTKNRLRDSSSTSSEKRPSSRNVSPPQFSSKSQQFSEESTAGSVKISGSLSPRLHQKKPETEKRSCPPTLPDSCKPRTSNGRTTDLSASSGKSRPKSSSLFRNDDQLSGISNETGDHISQLSDNSLFSDRKMNIGVTSSVRPPKCMTIRSMEKCDEDELQMELVTISPEHPSPVSVLNPLAYGYDELSPVKKISNTLERDRALDSDEIHQWSPVNRQKLQNIENLVQKLRRLNSHHDEAKTDYIALLCENTDPDFRYVSEILLASGLLLRDLSSGVKSFQLHPSGNPINPELFCVLEQTKASSLNNLQKVGEKFHRKLIFDAVNEILGRKLQSITISSDPWLTPNSVARKTQSAQKLLKELCCEIENFRGRKAKHSSDDEDDGLKKLLQFELMNHAENWTSFHNEISESVLDIERSIFKNLVDEIVESEGAYLRAKSGRSRQPVPLPLPLPK